MLDEFSQIWHQARTDDDIRVVVLRAGDRAFCTGVDVQEGLDMSANVWSQEDPGTALGAKQNKVWKPLICAVHGMVAGGAFYWINEADIVICSQDATFFDPHVSYGMTSALEPVGLSRRVPLGEALRWALLGLDERMSADRAHQLGLVSEITERYELWNRAAEIAAIIAAKPPSAILGHGQGDLGEHRPAPVCGLQLGLTYPQLGNPIGTAEVEREGFVKPKWRLR